MCLWTVKLTTQFTGTILLLILGTEAMNKQPLRDVETLNPAILQQITASAALLPGKTRRVLPNPLQLIKPII